jgi:hypothetical protein
MMKVNDNKIIPLAIPFIVWVSTTLLYFRNVLFSEFSQTIGDPADGRLITSIHEHWFRWFQGREGWFDLSFFYPLENTLGYSDTFLGTGLIFSLLRFLGIEPFISMQVVLIVLATIGYTSFFIWLNRYRRYGVGISSYCAGLFIISSQMYLASRNSHIQLLSIWQFPIGIILIEQCLRAFPKREAKLWIPATLLCAWFGLLTYSTFYIAYFFGLLISLACIGAVFFFGFKNSLKALYSYRIRLLHFIPGMTVLGLFAILFFKTYLPVLHETGGRSLEVVVEHLPLPKDLINHSETNALWGKISEHIWDYEHHLYWELELGFTPLFFLFLSLFSITRFLKNGARVGEAWIAGFTFLAGTLLVVRLGNFTFWAIPYYLVPGSEGIRAAFRFNLALLIPALFLLATYFNSLAQQVNIEKRIIMVCLGTFLVLEQIHFVQNAKTSRTEILEQVSVAIPPPPEADAFFAFRDVDDHWQQILVQHHAVHLSQVWNIPTINGRSGFVPEGWHFENTQPGSFIRQITPWARAKGITGTVFLYDIDSKKWVRGIDFGKNASANYENTDLLQLGPDIFREISFGSWSDQEVWGVWTNGRQAGFTFNEGNLPGPIAKIELDAMGFVHSRHPVTEVDVLVNDTLITTLTFDLNNQRQKSAVDLPAGIGNVETLSFQIRNPMSPSDLGLSTDSRQLGIGFYSLKFVP